MQGFKSFITEDGQAAGKLELVKTPLEKARPYAEEAFKKNGRDLDKDIPNFDKNYLFAQKHAGTGKTLRKDMPVIEEKDVKDLQRRLAKGEIDVNAPRNKDFTNPFPDGLKADKAKEWLEGGLKRFDGETKDDVVKVKLGTVKVGDLKPIQKQIYFDKSINATAQFGKEGTTKFLTDKNNTFIVSSDLHIIDGHHRYLSGILLDPNMVVNALIIDLPISKLLPLTLSYSDAVGNKRNS